jgi:hypothetical protein
MADEQQQPTSAKADNFAQDSKQPVENPSLEKGKDLGGDEVQQRMDRETAQGFSGINADPTPDENYTVAGVTSNAPTPETDPEAAKDAGSPKFQFIEADKKRMGGDVAPAEMVTLRNDEGREIQVSPKLRTNYPDYKEVGK